MQGPPLFGKLYISNSFFKKNNIFLDINIEIDVLYLLFYKKIFILLKSKNLYIFLKNKFNQMAPIYGFKTEM